ncbi:hypothetical protein AAVH_16618 [Aphelenchoides avenae]|nr:hypothetical protein AAVH_16618 [Aphelenchus avenae]
MPRINPKQSKPTGDDLLQQEPPKAANAGFNYLQQGNAGNFPTTPQKDSRQQKPSSRGSGPAAETTSEQGKGNMGVGEDAARRSQYEMYEDIKRQTQRSDLRAMGILNAQRLW